MEELTKMVNVAVDSMGEAHSPSVIITGAVDAINNSKTVNVFLVGKDTVVHVIFSNYKCYCTLLEVVTTDE